MGRTCSRPGCTAPAVVSVGFDAHRQLVWVVPIGQPVERLAGVLCEQHADRLTPPKGWWIDDRRSVPVLWREPGAPSAGTPSVAAAAPAAADAAGAATSSTGPTAAAPGVPGGAGPRPRTRAERRRAARAAAPKSPGAPTWTDEPLPGAAPDAALGPDAGPGPADGPDTGADAASEAASSEAAASEAASSEAAAWEPAFDEAGDARGQLDAESPLLAKAFRPRTRQR